MRKTRLVLHRLWQMLPVLVGISVVTFVLAQAIPGDPVRLIVGPRAPTSVIESVRERYGLDRPVLAQYFVYLGNLLQGDWGTSIAFRTPVLGLILSRFPPTLYLVGGGLFLSSLVALVLAVAAARRQDRWVDQAVRLFSTVGLGLPAFWLALVLSLVFAVRLGWFPSSGFGEGPVDHVRHLVLPWVTIGVVMAPILVRNLRATLIEKLQADFVVAERSKGLPERSIFLHHVLPNSLLTNLHLLGVVAIYTLGIAIIIEPVFAVPGLGQLFIGSIVSRDYFVIQGLTTIFAMLTIAATLAVDLLSLVVDPRIG
jgi:ABC-type dipeptide/oligopeptide/nickel transport system permease component